MSMNTSTDSVLAYEKLVSSLREIGLLSSAASLLHWDERTQMPVKGTEHRANQLSLLSRLIHEQFTSPRIGELLATVESSEAMKDRESDIAVNVRETRRSYDRAVKLPASLVEEMAKTEILSQATWVEARKKSDYAAFEPWLGKVLNLKLKEADCVGYKESRYDALLDPFEPDETAANLTKVFESLRGPLVELVGKIADSPRKSPAEILERKYAVAGQEKLGREAATKRRAPTECGKTTRAQRGRGPAPRPKRAKYRRRERTSLPRRSRRRRRSPHACPARNRPRRPTR